MVAKNTGACVRASLLILYKLWVGGCMCMCMWTVERWTHSRTFYMWRCVMACHGYNHIYTHSFKPTTTTSLIHPLIYLKKKMAHTGVLLVTLIHLYISKKKLTHTGVMLATLTHPFIYFSKNKKWHTRGCCCCCCRRALPLPRGYPRLPQARLRPLQAPGRSVRLSSLLIKKMRACHPSLLVNQKDACHVSLHSPWIGG